jgi:hypothetical protein
VQFRNITFTPAVQTSNPIPNNLEIGEEGIFFTCTRSSKEEEIMIALNILEDAYSKPLQVKPYIETEPSIAPPQPEILGVGTDFKLYTGRR